MSFLAEQQNTIAALRNAERDIDRIVVEHLLCAPDFREWFLGAAGAPELDRAELSVAAVRGRQTSDNGVDIVLRDGVNRPGFTGGQNSRRIARYGTDIKEEDREAVFTRVPRACGAAGDGTPR